MNGEAPRAPLLPLVAALAFLATAAPAQEAPFNVTEVGHFDQPGQLYSDVWADGDFAYLAHRHQRVVDIVDLSDPANPALAATYDTGVSGARAQDVKVHDGLMFVGLEEVSPGCQIVDVRDPYAPVKLTDVTVLYAVHNLFYDQGWLYLADGAQALVDVLDLRSYNPDDPPAVIPSFAWRLTGVGKTFVHDVTVQDGRLYAAAWESLRVYDVSEIADRAPVFLGSVPGSNVHSSWATDDGRFLVVAEEHPVGGLTLYEVIDNGGSVSLEVRDYHFLPTSRAGSVHNPVIVGHRVYASWNTAGLQVLEIDPDAASWSLVASFDTTPKDGAHGTFDGCWGVYPFLGPDRVLASDRETGLWVLDVEPNVLLFDDRGGRPRTIEPGAAAPVTVGLSAVGAPPDPATVALHQAVDGGAPVAATMSDLGGGLFSGLLPASGCGSFLELSVHAANTRGDVFVDPSPALAAAHRVDVATRLDRVFEDTFETDLGWTVQDDGVTSGGWERGDPNGTGAQPENDFSGAPDGECFFTGQAVPGEPIDAADVDGGPTILTSPPIDLSAGDASAGSAILTYAFWLFNDEEQASDGLVVEVSSDGVDWVEVRRHVALLGGWHEASFFTGDFIAPSAQARIRFSIRDDPNDSVTEAAIDSVRADVLSCDTAVLFTDGFESGVTSAWSATTP